MFYYCGREQEGERGNEEGREGEEVEGEIVRKGGRDRVRMNHIQC